MYLICFYFGQQPSFIYRFVSNKFLYYGNTPSSIYLYSANSH